MRKMLLAALLATSLPVSAAFQIQFSPADTFSGTPPAGSITATFTNAGVDTVSLSIVSALAPGEFVLPGDGFYFNLRPTMDPTALNFLTVTGPVTTFSTGVNAFKPDGDGKMDLNFTFSPPNLKAFEGGDTATYTLTGVGLDESDFNFLSDCAQGCGTGAHLSAIHVGDTPMGGEGSAWVGAHVVVNCPDCTPNPTGIPEPGTLVLTAPFIVGMARFLRRQKRPDPKSQQ